MKWSVLAASVSVSLLAMPGLSRAQNVPRAISSDPLPDKSSPAGLHPFALPTGGGTINAVLLTAAGVGRHPTVLLLHGFPGNEQNLDLAQAIRRDGWNVLTLHYRGAWGSPGAFTFAHVQEDTAAALAWLRDPSTSAAPGIDPGRIVAMGHSMGGWAAAFAGARDANLMGTALISAANMGAIGASPRPIAAKIMDDNMGASAGIQALAATPDSLADELIANSRAYDLTQLKGALPQHPLLLVTSDDGLAGASDTLAKSLRAAGDRSVMQAHIATDHSYSDHRIALETAILGWLESLPGAPRPP